MSTAHERVGRIVKVRDFVSIIDEIAINRGIDPRANADLVLGIVEKLNLRGWVELTAMVNLMRGPDDAQAGIPSEKTQRDIATAYRQRMGGQIRRAS